VANLDIHGLAFNTNALVINPLAEISRFYTELTFTAAAQLRASPKSDQLF
jgi:hypothetical protein